MRRLCLALAAVAALAACIPPAWPPPPVTAPPASGVQPVFLPGGYQEEAYGRAEGYPVGTRRSNQAQRLLVGSLSHFDRVLPARVVPKPAEPWQFRRAAAALPEIRYSHRGSSSTLSEYLDRNPVTGFLILRDDEILFEQYRYGRHDAHRFTSFSMAKTVVAMLVGIAAAEGAIRSIDDPAETYVPGLKGSAYGGTPIRALLHMSSGIAFSERYDGADDIAKLGRALNVPNAAASAEAALAQFDRRVAAPDTKFSYASAETMVLGLVLRQATKRAINEYLAEKIWQPIGAEAEASWNIDLFGNELAQCCFNAVLRDFARLGRLLAHDGNWNGRQVIPRQWMIEATSVAPQDRHLAPGTATPVLGYGYQTWLLPGERRMFSLRGVRGQAILVDPQSKLVMVQTAARAAPTDPGNAENISVFRGIVAALAEAAPR